MDFEWVEGDVCEVSLDFINPMPFEIRISNLMLLTEGGAFESWTSSLVLQASPSAQSCTLRGRPQAPGELKIVGYSSQLMGVTSNCRFKFIPSFKIPQYTVNVIPALPFIQILSSESSCGGSDNASVKSSPEGSAVSLSMSGGETREVSVVIHNVSSQPVETIDLNLETNRGMDRELLSQVFQYSSDNLQSQLPICPGGKASLTLYVYALGEFLCPGRIMDDHMESSSMVSGSEPPSLLSGGPSSINSRQSVATSSIRGRKTQRTESSASLMSSSSRGSVRSGSSSSTCAGNSSIRTRTTTPLTTPAPSATRSLEATLKMIYSGGAGLLDHQCRTAQVSLAVEVSASVLVTRWDVLPADTPHQCYIVLDLLNTAPHEMDLHYTPTKHILIEAGESCRVPVPTDRCPLNKLNLEGGVEESSCSDMSSALGAHVASLVELRWTLGPEDTPGRASLTGITFPPHTHDLITMAPIHWDVKLNGQEMVGGVENPGVVGEVMYLSVGIINCSGRTLPPFSLRLTAFQDHQNGHLNYRLDAKMSTTGATKLTLPQLSEGEEVHHECGLLFFTAGMYKIEITCSPAATAAQTSLYENIIPAHQHAWKFAPPLEIAITDV